jgi:hypothetical protein
LSKEFTKNIKFGPTNESTEILEDTMGDLPFDPNRGRDGM